MDEELLPRAKSLLRADLAAEAAEVTSRAAAAQVDGCMPAIYLGHGAPPLVDDELWVAELAAWARALPRPTAILMVSAHWTERQVTLGASSDGVPLVYDFYGFPDRYYQTLYPAPAAPELAARVRELLDGIQPVAESPRRGLDHGAYVPLLVMCPRADVPVLQVSLPSHDPWALMGLGECLRPLRNEGVLIMGSGFLTHGLPFLRDFRTDAPPPDWSNEFDAWAAAALKARDLDALADYRRAPSARYAHPSAEHFVPLFVTLGAADESAAMTTPITGYYLGLSKRSIQIA